VTTSVDQPFSVGCQGEQKMSLTKEIEKDRQELSEILSRDDGNMGKKTSDLQDLAGRVGASTINLIRGHGDASVPELAQSIHHALQTKSTVAALQISRKYLVVSVILAAIALFSMVATWIGPQ
jgi:hypothetical protein